MQESPPPPAPPRPLHLCCSAFRNSQIVFLFSSVHKFSLSSPFVYLLILYFIFLVILLPSLPFSLLIHSLLLSPLVHSHRRLFYSLLFHLSYCPAFCSSISLLSHSNQNPLSSSPFHLSCLYYRLVSLSSFIHCWSTVPLAVTLLSRHLDVPSLFSHFLSYSSFSFRSFPPPSVLFPYPRSLLPVLSPYLCTPPSLSFPSYSFSPPYSVLSLSLSLILILPFLIFSPFSCSALHILSPLTLTDPSSSVLPSTFLTPSLFHAYLHPSALLSSPYSLSLSSLSPHLHSPLTIPLPSRSPSLEPSTSSHPPFPLILALQSPSPSNSLFPSPSSHPSFPLILAWLWSFLLPSNSLLASLSLPSRTNSHQGSPRPPPSQVPVSDTV